MQMRRPPPAYFSPAYSSNQKQLHNSIRRRTPARKHVSSSCQFTEEEREDFREAGSLTAGEEDDDQSKTPCAAGRNSSELLLMMALMGCAGGRRGSSLGSCPGWGNMGSLPGHLPELCPVTQSPVRGSPMSSGISSERCCRSQVSISTAGDLSFATAKQSSGIISNDGKKMGLLGKSAEGLSADQKRDLQLVKNLNPAMKTSEIEFPARYSRADTCEKKASQAVRSARAGGRRRGRQSGNCRVSFKKNASLEVMGKLPTVGEAEDDEDRGSPSRVHRSPIPSCVSPDISHTDEGYFSSSSNLGSDYNLSDVNSVVGPAVAPSRGRRLRPSYKETRKDFVERILAWKESKTMKLMNRLKRAEASIEAWEKKKAKKAKMEMKKLETKLEKKRAVGMEKMQRKIMGAEKEAAKRKAREKEAVSKQIARIAEAFEEIVLTGRAPWKLIFL